MLHETASHAVMGLASEMGITPHDFHGSPCAVRIEHCFLNQPCYLGIFHASRDWYTSGNWPYMFAAEPPFEILSIGYPLSLKGGRNITFVSSLLLNNGRVIIGYNIDDTFSKVFSMPAYDFVALHFENVGK